MPLIGVLHRPRGEVMGVQIGLLALAEDVVDVAREPGALHLHVRLGTGRGVLIDSLVAVR